MSSLDPVNTVVYIKPFIWLESFLTTGILNLVTWAFVAYTVISTGPSLVFSSVTTTSIDREPRSYLKQE